MRSRMRRSTTLLICAISAWCSRTVHITGQPAFSSYSESWDGSFTWENSNDGRVDLDGNRFHPWWNGYRVSRIARATHMRKCQARGRECRHARRLQCRGGLLPQTDKMTHHRKAQLLVTLAVALATVAHFLCLLCAPWLEPLAPLAGLLANLVWIWVE